MSTASERLVTPCCGAPVLPRPFQCVHEHEEWRRRANEAGLLAGERCFMTERPREPVRPVPVPVQGSFGL